MHRVALQRVSDVRGLGRAVKGWEKGRLMLLIGGGGAHERDCGLGLWARALVIVRTLVITVGDIHVLSPKPHTVGSRVRVKRSAVVATPRGTCCLPLRQQREPVLPCVVYCNSCTVAVHSSSPCAKPYQL